MANGRFGATFRQMETLIRVGSVANFSDAQLLGRFLDRRDGGEAAFEVLVSRHGAMVMGVCRRVLGTADGAEDAFQATFLVLVRRAGSIRNRESLGPWLHGVARRVSLRARRDAARRRERERASLGVVGGDSRDDGMAATLHDEIARLPEKYRAPIVLCDLEGRSHAEAALRLDWPIGTVSGRLSRARALLRSRIARRGMALSPVSLAATIGPRSASASMAPRLAAETARLATSARSGGAIAPALASLAGVATSPRAAIVVRWVAGLIVATGITLSGREALRVTEAGASSPSSTPHASPSARATAAPMACRPPRRLDDEREIVAVALAPDGVTLASGDVGATVTIWDIDTGLEKRTLLGHDRAVTSLAFSADGRMLRSSSRDRTVTVWDLATGRATMTVTWLEPRESPAPDLGPDPQGSGRGLPGRDRCADGPGREADAEAGV